jgi:two-component system chemotaxis sensor kinase CheA
MSLNEDLQRTLVHEMLIESYEGLDRFDRYLLDLEQGTADGETMNAIFRVIHTIKGTSGCLALNRIERVAHVGESLLQLMREGRLQTNRERISTLLAMSDALREMLGHLEREGHEGTTDFGALVTKLDNLTKTDYTGEGVKWGLFDDDEEVAATPAAPVEPAMACFATPPAAAAPPAAPVVETAPVVSVAPAAPVAPLEPALSVVAGTAPVAAPSAPAPTPAHALALVPEHDAEAAHAATGAAPAPAGPKGPSVSESAIRVDVGQLDRLMNLVGELVLARNQIIQHSSTSGDDGLTAASQRLNIITSELQENVMKTRMQPIGNVWSKFPRVVRDLSSELGKQVHLVMEGNETELDRTIIEAIKDPLTHIVRNSVDHGIEKPEARRTAGKTDQGSLVMRAFHEGGKVIIEIADDGAGIAVERVVAKAVERGILTADRAARLTEREAFHLIFAPGFSTAEKVTNVSGRGVGMDVVRTNIEKIGGSVDIQSEAGRGTTIRIKIPLTLAIIPALIVTSGGDRFAIPQVSLLELVRLSGEQARLGMESIYGAPVFRLRGALLPLVFLNREMKLGDATYDPENVNIVVLQADGRPFGLIVDSVSDTEEIVVKPLAKQLKGLPFYAGSTIMGDGRIALILDVLGLAQRAHVVTEQKEATLAGSVIERAEAIEDKETLLILGVGAEGRMAIPLSMVARLEEFPLSKVEKSGESRVVQYRDQLLPLIQLEHHVPGGDREARMHDPVSVVVYNDHGRNVGLVVDRIEDIVHAAITVRRRTNAPGIRGSVVVQKRVTDLLDVPEILAAAGAATTDEDFVARAA